MKSVTTIYGECREDISKEDVCSFVAHNPDVINELLTVSNAVKEIEKENLLESKGIFECNHLFLQDVLNHLPDEEFKNLCTKYTKLRGSNIGDNNIRKRLDEVGESYET